MTEDASITPSLPPHLQDAPGVQFNPPSPDFIQKTQSLIDASTANIGVDEKGQLLFVAQHQGGKTSVNFVVAVKVGENIKLVHWIGKSWGTPVEVGVAASWKF